MPLAVARWLPARLRKAPRNRSERSLVEGENGNDREPAKRANSHPQRNAQGPHQRCGFSIWPPLRRRSAWRLAI